MKVFISPHNDDETLFGAFTLQREAPVVVVVVFDGYVQGNRGLSVTAEQRRLETARACRLLGCPRVEYLGFRDDDRAVTADQISARLRSFIGEALVNAQLWAPAMEVNGHPQHDLCSVAAEGWNVVENYMTYTSAGKSYGGREVKIERPEWIKRKLQALAQYESQMSLDPRMGCWPHFVNDLREYYAR